MLHEVPKKCIICLYQKARVSQQVGKNLPDWQHMNKWDSSALCGRIYHTTHHNLLIIDNYTDLFQHI